MKANNLENENKMLLEENKELNEMLNSLASEVTSLKNQVKMMQSAEEHRKSLNSSFQGQTKSRIVSPRNNISNRGKIQFWVKINVIDEEIKAKMIDLATQKDLLYMLNAQANALEALL